MKRVFSIFAIIFALSVFASAQTSAFNYQGRLNDGNTPANGKYDLEFRLYDAITGDNIVGSAISKPNLTLINGVFSTQLDFGANAFDGANRFLEVRLRQTVPANAANATPNAFVILGPRQQILSTPYTVRSYNSSFADNARYAQNLGGLPASRYLISDTNGDVTFSGKVNFNGIVSQPSNAYGLVKAMVYVNPYISGSQKIVRCYNSKLSGAAATTVPCGFTADYHIDDGDNLGHCFVDFGFDLRTSFFSLTTVTTKGGGSIARRMTVSSIAGDFNGAGGGNISTFNGNYTDLEIITRYTDDQSFTNDPFLLTVY